MSQEGYRLFINICDLYLVLLQVMLFLVVWDIFFRPERGKKEALSAGIFAAANVLLRLCPGVPGWARYAVSAAAVLGYCRIRYKGCLEKAVFTLLLLYNFHGMSGLKQPLPVFNGWPDGEAGRPGCRVYAPYV